MPNTCRPILAGLLGLLVAASALAGGGPHNVLIVANAQSEDSMAVANAYRAAREIPERNLCVVDIPLPMFRHAESLKANDFDKQLVAPLKEFLSRHPAADRLLYVVLCPDLPLRVNHLKPVGPRSIPAVLTLLGVTPAGAMPPRNPYFRRPHAFEKLPVPLGDADPVGRFRLTTVLRGYQRSDALALVSRSVAADGTAPAGTFCFVPSPHTRGFEETVAWLTGSGHEAVLNPRGKPVAGRQDVMAYFSGGFYSDLKWKDITSNTYRPGAVVDMLESWGATWQNWRGFAWPRQVPVPWLIRAGATGVHGTTDEPYSYAFPSTGHARPMLTNYLAGCNLAEAYWSAIPVLQWQNVVFGDPLCAPYAVRSDVELHVAPPDEGGGMYQARVRITERKGAARPGEVRFFVDGRFAGMVEDVRAGDGGVRNASFGLDAAGLADGWHRARAVVVDDAPAAVQSWATADFLVGPGAGGLQLERIGDDAALAAGDTLKFRTTYAEPAGAAAPKSLALLAGDREVAAATGRELTLDTTCLGPGRHELQATARDAEGALLALSNFVSVDLVEPMHVVRSLPSSETGRRPVFLIEFNETLPFAQAVVQRAVRLTQGSRSIGVRCSVQDRVLIAETLTPLHPGQDATLRVSFPQGERRSRAFTQTVTPTDDARLLFTMTLDAKYDATVEGITSIDGNEVKPAFGKRAIVVLGLVDINVPDRPARCSLPACGVSAVLHVGEAARPEGKDRGEGAGLGVLYSDIDNHCYARVER